MTADPAAVHGRPRPRRDAGVGRALLSGLRRGGLRYVRTITRDVLECYAENNILTYASAIGFRTFFAIFPCALFLLGLMGALGLRGLWVHHIGPSIQANVSPAVFKVIDEVAGQALGRSHTFWVTFGALLAIWEISGAVRAIIGVFNRIYGAEEERGTIARFALSIALAAAVGALLMYAVLMVWLGPLLLSGLPGAVEALIRYGTAIGALVVVVGLLVHVAPRRGQPLPWVSFAAGFTVALWIAMSLLFGWYVTSVANYGSIFGDLATVIVTFEYLYLSAAFFLTSIQIDAAIRREGGGPTGPRRRLPA